MRNGSSARVAIIDFGLGNLYSVKNACACVGLSASISSSKEDILTSDAIILPGVGAYGNAMTALEELGLVPVLHAFVQSGKPVIGICLGMQLLMGRSEEFGHHKGLGIIPGRVVRLRPKGVSNRPSKVPQIGWNAIHRRQAPDGTDPWLGTILDGTPDAEPMYFVHSYVVVPDDNSCVLSTTVYEDVEFCSSLRYRNVIACQFHPERSGSAGLRIYRNLSNVLGDRIKGESSESVA
jgi:imidazole glycerol-phosphate synthase subunit HisH